MAVMGSAFNVWSWVVVSLGQAGEFNLKNINEVVVSLGQVLSQISVGVPACRVALIYCMPPFLCPARLTPIFCCTVVCT